MNLADFRDFNFILARNTGFAAGASRSVSANYIYVRKLENLIGLLTL